MICQMAIQKLEHPGFNYSLYWNSKMKLNQSEKCNMKINLYKL